MISRTSIAGLFLIVLGLAIVIVHALNMSNLFSVDTLLPELGVILVGLAVQILGLGMIVVSRK
jgi:hypothetical protein